MTLGETELMGADIPPDRFQPMRSAHLTLLVDSNHEADCIYALLADDKFGTFVDASARTKDVIERAGSEPE